MAERPHNGLPPIPTSAYSYSINQKIYRPVKQTDNQSSISTPQQRNETSGNLHRQTKTLTSDYQPEKSKKSFQNSLLRRFALLYHESKAAERFGNAGTLRINGNKINNKT